MKIDKDIADFETLFKEIQQLKFELRAADDTYEKSIAELKSVLLDVTNAFYPVIDSRNEHKQEDLLIKIAKILGDDN